MPCHNSAEFVAQALESAFGQSRPVHEVLVVDDASTDGSVLIAESFPVRLERLETNRGPAHARNVGLSQATGEFVAFLDADDWWLPEHCEVVAGLLDRHPNAVAAASAALRVGTRDGVFAPMMSTDETVHAFWTLLHYGHFPHMTSIVRRQTLVDLGGFDETMRVGSDYDLWLRLSRRAPFVCSHDVTARYRWHDAQISADTLRQMSAMYRSRMKVHQELLDEREDRMAQRVGGEIRLRWLHDMAQARLARDTAWIERLKDLADTLPPVEAAPLAGAFWRKARTRLKL